MKKLLFILTTAVGAFSLSLTAFASEDFTFNNGCIEKYNGTEEYIVIPAEINGEKVTSLGVNAFADNDVVKSITIPATVEEIGTENMGDYGLYPFLNTPCLEEIKVEEGNPVFTDIDGVLINSNTGELLFYPANKAGSSYTIPEQVKTVRTLAINKYNNLTDLYVYNSQVEFGTFAIGYGDNLTVHCIKGSVAESYCKNSFNILYIVEKGDIDGDNFVTASDASTLLTNLLNNTVNETISNYADIADADGDGGITSNDCATILTIVLNGQA